MKAVHALPAFREENTFADHVREVVDRCGVPKKAIAADLDLSPSEFSMKLSGYEGRGIHIDALPGLLDSIPVAFAEEIVAALVERIEERKRPTEVRKQELLTRIAHAQDETTRLLTELKIFEKGRGR